MDPPFSLSNVLNKLAMRKAVDLLVYLYTTLFIALWIGQQIPGLTYMPFTFTSATNSGESFDYCAADILYNINSTHINAIYNREFSNTFDYYFTSTNLTKNVPDEYASSPLKINVLKVQMLILKSAGLEAATPPFKLFSVPFTHYCIGVQHRSVAYDKDPPNVDYSEFWNYVKENRDTYYSSLNDAAYLRNIEILYYMPIWVYLACILVAEMYMHYKLYVYETDANSVFKKTTKIEPGLFFSFFGVFLPIVIDTIVLTFLALKISGICFVNDNDIFIIAGLHMVAMILRNVPIFIMRYNMPKTPSADSGTSMNIQIKNRSINFSAKLEPAPPRHRAMILLYYCMFGMIVVIAGIWISNDLPSANVAIFDEHCETGVAVATVDSCVGPDGHGYRSKNAHYVLLGLMPPLLLLIWRLGNFFYFTAQITEHGTIAGKANTNSINMELQAGVAVMGTWAIKLHKLPLDKDSDTGIFIKYTNGAYVDTTLSNVRMIMAGRFTIPYTTAVIAILLGILKLSEYAFWGGMPWWGISTMIAVAIGVSILTEFVEIGFKMMKNKKVRLADQV